MDGSKYGVKRRIWNPATPPGDRWLHKRGWFKERVGALIFDTREEACEVRDRYCHARVVPVKGDG